MKECTDENPKRATPDAVRSERHGSFKKKNNGKN